MVKKILFIITQSEFGGAQRYVFETSVSLSQENYKVLVAIGGKNKGFAGKIKNKNSQIETFSLKHLKRTPCPLEIIFSIKEIFKLLKQKKPDVLFLCSSSAGFLGSIASFLYKRKNPRIKTIYRIGGWAFNDPRNFISKKLIILAEKITALLKDKIIVNSEFDLQTALKHKIAPKEKIVKIYNGINPEELNFLSKQKARKYLKLKIKNEKLKLQIKNQNFKIIGTIANFYKTKGLKHLIEAANILVSKSKMQNFPATIPLKAEQRRESFKFIIIGEGKQRKKLECLIKKYNLQNIVFLLGRIPNAQKYLKAFDVFVLPSLKEGFPWVILEAITGEVPIIATNVGAIPEIIENNKQGFLTESGNSQNLAKKIQDIVQNPELQNKFVQLSKDKLKSFSKEKMLEETKKVILS